MTENEILMTGQFPITRCKAAGADACVTKRGSPSAARWRARAHDGVPARRRLPLLFPCAVILVLFLALRAAAQTNTPSRGPLIITSHSATIDLTTRTVIHQGDVHADEPQMKLRCEWAEATMPPSGGHINHIICKTNVVIDYTDDKGQTNHITSDQAVYDYNVQNNVTNETVTFTGNPRIENVQSITTGDVIVWDRANNKVNIVEGKTIFKQGLGGMPAEKPRSGRTNAPPGHDDE